MRYGLKGKARTRPDFFRVVLGPCAQFETTLLRIWGTGALGALFWGTWGTRLGHLGHSVWGTRLGALVWGTRLGNLGHLGHSSGALEALVWGT